MITKKELLECAKASFTKFGSKRITLDELAKTLGISKKTIYVHFKNKETLVNKSVASLINDYKLDINEIVKNNTNDDILTIILIYKRGFEYLRYFKPSFIFGLKKYYPHAYTTFDNFRKELSYSTILNLLNSAKEKGLILPSVNVKLITELYFLRVESIAFSSNNLFTTYDSKTILDHLIVHNLKAITVDSYSNSYF
ncbi:MULTISPECIES: TetR/AcrR family transcriptional regulator [unclassified Cellulophaga]|uniref:TetR/AcrR family transcriptional regulator n=1 Tax=unclassified Cellulophaga TaxID=2634405 RepID=UPI000C2CD89D|nr:MULTISPECIES: TetR/AcrR family transcriptional regulator [unclassified Cellulophaga]MDO6492367.1 TetR/AcrR family transcriptional regulator [Cellulophaga sp. 2_MG-2023]MDO6496133.1 TetR/AcrR family transcriptional regulator [Cellulophaga sp. 3_MG-2023]PKB44975.1 TetR family transcriptional regulator [Cellulophaga sp. RHA19]